jgi:hypothetical protein
VLKVISFTTLAFAPLVIYQQSKKKKKRSWYYYLNSFDLIESLKEHWGWV